MKDLLKTKRSWSIRRIVFLLVMVCVLHLFTMILALVMDVDDIMLVLKENLVLFTIVLLLLAVLILTKNSCNSFLDNLGMYMFFMATIVVFRAALQKNATHGGGMMLKDFAWPFMLWLSVYLCYTFTSTSHRKRDMTIRIIATLLYVNGVAVIE